jgi:hypothetical protein
VGVRVGSASAGGNVGGGKRLRLELGLIKIDRKTAATQRVANRVNAVRTFHTMVAMLLEGEVESLKS